MQRYFAKDKIDNKFILEDSDYHHIKNVMRMKDDDNVEIVYNNSLYIGCLVNVNENLEIKLLKEEKSKQETMPKITLIVPLLKEQKFDFILQKATELGVYEIVPFLAERSIIKAKSDVADKKISRWNKICKEASEQSKRVDIPIIEHYKTLKDLKNLNGLNLICSTKQNLENIKNIVKSKKNYDRINIVIGPEGGLSNKEEEYLQSIGYLPITLGSRIMRVETVPLFIMSILNYEYME